MHWIARKKLKNCSRCFENDCSLIPSPYGVSKYQSLLDPHRCCSLYTVAHINIWIFDTRWMDRWSHPNVGANTHYKHRPTPLLCGKYMFVPHASFGPMGRISMDAQRIHCIVSRLATMDIVSPLSLSTRDSSLSGVKHTLVDCRNGVLDTQNIDASILHHLLCIVAYRLEFSVLQKSTWQYRNHAPIGLDELCVVFDATEIISETHTHPAPKMVCFYRNHPRNMGKTPLHTPHHPTNAVPLGYAQQTDWIE